MSWVKEKKSLASLWSATAEKLEKLMTFYNVRDYKYIRNILKRIILPEHFKPKLLWGVLCWIAISHYLRINIRELNSCYCSTTNGRWAFVQSPNKRTLSKLPCRLHNAVWIVYFYVTALIGAPMQHTRVFHLRDQKLLRHWAGYLLPKASAVTTCIQPNLVRHEICITLKLMFYYVTHYEYYITGP